MKPRQVAVLALLAGCCACASAPPPKAEVASEPKVAQDLPNWCSGDKKNCLPERDFASRLCSDQYLGAALYLFQKQTPWQRRWVKLKEGHPAINAEGGPAGKALLFGEELLVMAITEPAGSAAEAPAGKRGKKAKKPDPEVLALRWDGTCASLKASNLTNKQPKSWTHPLVRWGDIDLSVQRSLLREPAIAQEVKGWEKACIHIATSECEIANEMLSNSIVNHVRRGTKLSTPDKRP